jgi:hypothetical protein
MMALLCVHTATRKPVSTGLPPSSGLGWEEVRGPSSEAVSAGVADTAAVSAAVEPLMAPPVPGVQKPPRWVGKTVPGPFRGGAVAEGLTTNGCWNVTRLAAADPLPPFEVTAAMTALVYFYT